MSSRKISADIVRLPVFAGKIPPRRALQLVKDSCQAPQDASPPKRVEKDHGWAFSTTISDVTKVGYSVLGNYLPVLIFLVIALVLGVAMLTMGSVLGPRRPDSAKDSPYECGFEAFEDSRMKFDVRYYLVAILFIIFDLEIAFLFPWAVVLDSIGTAGFVAMGIFIGVLVIGFIYEWKKGALEWE